MGIASPDPQGPPSSRHRAAGPHSPLLCGSGGTPHPSRRAQREWWVGRVPCGAHAQAEHRNARRRTRGPTLQAGVSPARATRTLPPGEGLLRAPGPSPCGRVGLESPHMSWPLPTVTMIQQPRFWERTPENENRVSERYSHTRVHSSMTRDRPKMEATQMHIDGWLDRQMWCRHTVECDPA